MLKKNKIILSVAASLIGVGTILAASLTPIILKANPTVNSLLNARMSEEDWYNNAPFEFDNKNYLNLNDAYNDLVNKVGGINTQQFIGEINNKNEDGSIILANNPVYEYNLDKITTAYMDANGRYTNDYDKAINSFVNASTLVANYYDYKGNYFLDEEDAKYSMNSFGSMGIAYYEIEDYQGNKVKINPLNKDDIKTFKTIAYDWIVNKDKTNSGSGPFALKLVGKDDNQAKITTPTYSKSNEVTSDKLNDQWSDFVSTFKTNLRQELSNVILNVLKNNDIIKTEIYIKPYVLEQDKDPFTYYYNDDGFQLDDPEDLRFMWYFENNGNKSLSINSKSLNLESFTNLANIFLDRDKFTEYYNIDTYHFNSNSYSPKYQVARVKNNIGDYFDNNYNVMASMPKPSNNSSPVSKGRTVATILEKSNVYDNGSDGGPSYIRNYMLTFGVRPYIDKDAQIAQGSWNSDYKMTTNSNKMSFASFISDLISMPNSQNSTKDSQSNFQEYVYNKTLEERKGTSIYNFLNQYEYSDVVGENILSVVTKNGDDSTYLYNYNIFNRYVVSGLGDPDNHNDNTDPNKKKTPQFSNFVYNQLCNKFGIVVNDNIFNSYNDFNSAIDMRQLRYFDATWGTKYKSEDNYLGISKDDLNKINTPNTFILDNFINVGDITSTKISSKYNGLTNNFKAIITYNDMPVFEINNDCLEGNEQSVNNLLNASGFKKNNSSNTAQAYSEDSFDPELFTNISTSYSIVDDKTRINKSNNYVINNSQPMVYKKNESNEIIVEDVKNLSPTYNHLPTDNSDPSTMDRGIYDAVSLYNQNIQKLNLSKTDNGLLEEYRPKDFLMLFDATPSVNQVTPLKLHYCETYSGVDNINLSLSSKFINSKLAFNYDQLSELKERLKVFNTPAKVYFIYHNDNLLIKDKIEYNASNPDFIDNPELVIQNALRKYGLAPETDHIMYNTDNGYVSLLNNVFVLYNFTLNDRNYYFDSFANAKDKLISYIKYNSYKI